MELSKKHNNRGFLVAVEKVRHWHSSAVTDQPRYGGGLSVGRQCMELNETDQFALKEKELNRGFVNLPL